MGYFRPIAATAMGCAGATLAWFAISCSSTGSGNGQLCQNYTSYLQACGSKLSPACVTAFENQCPQFVTKLSNAAVTAEETCLSPPYDCDAGLALAECLLSKVAAAPPTAAQQKVKTDFCAQCPDGKSATYTTSCSTFFPSGTPDAQAFFSVGLFVLEYSDSIAQQIDQDCTGAGAPDAGDCAQGFFTCALAAVQKAESLPAACLGDAGTD